MRGSGDMKQMTLTAAADQSRFDRHRKPTRRDAFLAQMQTLVPWSRLVALIQPHCPRPVTAARPSGWSACCASTCCSTGSICQTWPAKRRCTTPTRCSPCRHRPGSEPVPNATTLCKFRHLLEQHEVDVWDRLRYASAAWSRGRLLPGVIGDAPTRTSEAPPTADR